ncbi:MAG: DUF1858 domain-containing protein [Calditrichaeota bacterium]|nr:MAG: DUF1858 domain-containing protein [Calditrichota bacterium]
MKPETPEKPEIVKDILIEDLVRAYPAAVKFLMDKGIKCIACGEPIWGTLADAAREKGFSEEAIDDLVSRLKDEVHQKHGGT